MKIDSTRDVTGNLGNLESHTMGIKADGKAFRILVKGIYSDPIAAFIREISTNAFDSHIEAGIPDEPFHVTLPDTFDPYFRVRDYGVSMDHEAVFNIFGTLFESTKDESNDAVGAFGLGSKSPLAYADSFEVSAFLNGELRTYLVSLGPDGAPVITLLGTMVTDKPDGIEVAIPIRSQDHGRVTSKAREILRAFPLLPTVTGTTLEGLNALHTTSTGDAFVVSGSSSYVKVEVRQGCVLYPVDDRDLTSVADNALRYGYKLILDVPIGTVGVATSREALELNDDARREITNRVAAAIADIDNEIAERFDNHNNRLEAVRDLVENGVGEFWQQNVKFRGKTLADWVSLELDKGKADHRDAFIPSVKAGTSRGLVNLRQIRYRDVADKRFVIQHSTDKVKRSGLRYREFVTEHGKDDVYLMTDPEPRTLERLMRLWGVKRDQFVWIGDIADPGPAERGQRGPSSGTVQGVTTPADYNNAVTTLPEDYYWVEISRPNYFQKREALSVQREIVSLGGEDFPVLIFNTTARKRYKPDPESEVKAVRKALVADKVDEIKVAYRTELVYNKLPWGVDRLLVKDRDEALAGQASYALGVVDRQEMEGEAETIYASYREQFPMLFAVSENDTSAMEAYIAECES